MATTALYTRTNPDGQVSTIAVESGAFVVRAVWLGEERTVHRPATGCHVRDEAACVAWATSPTSP